MTRDTFPVTEKEARASQLNRVGRAEEAECAKALWLECGQRSKEFCMAGEVRGREGEGWREGE